MVELLARLLNVGAGVLHLGRQRLHGELMLLRLALTVLDQLRVNVNDPNVVEGQFHYAAEHGLHSIALRRANIGFDGRG